MQTQTQTQTSTNISTSTVFKKNQKVTFPFGLAGVGGRPLLTGKIVNIRSSGTLEVKVEGKDYIYPVTPAKARLTA